MNPEDLTPDERRAFIRQENMPARAYDALADNPSMPRSAYRRIALAAAKRRQRAKTRRAVILALATVGFLLGIAALPYLLH